MSAIVPPPSYLFDRARPGHAWFAALGALEGSSLEGHPALAQNWRMDGRVDALRERNLDASGCFPGDAFVEGINDYFLKAHCRSANTTPFPDYADLANQGNLIPRDRFPGHKQHLVHVASLRSLLIRAISHYADFASAVNALTGHTLPNKPNQPDISRLVAALQRRGNEATREFSGLLSQALGDTEPHWWAAFAHEVGDLEGSDDWTQAVRKTGQGKIDTGEWLIGWRYSPRVVGKLYRPTVAEAGAYAYHFPSPLESRYGVTMPLAAGLPAIREVIHAPLKDNLCAQSCIGFGQVREDPVPVADGSAGNAWFAARRREHAMELMRAHPSDDQARDWLLRHAVLP